MSEQLQASNRDQYVSFLISSIAISGLLFLLQIERQTGALQASINILDSDFFVRHTPDSEQDFEEVEIPAPDGATDLNHLQQAVTDAISSTPALSRFLEENISEPADGTGRRKSGTGSEGKDSAPSASRNRFQHWKMRFTLQNENEYLEQMDALDIELGLLDRVQPVIQYAARISSQPRFRQGNRGKNCPPFFSTQQVAKMTALERAAADEKGVDPESGIRRTVFGMRRNGDGWEVYLISLLPF